MGTLTCRLQERRRGPRAAPVARPRTLRPRARHVARDFNFFVTNFFVTRAHRNRSASPAESSFVTREPSWRRRRRTSRSRRLCVIGPSGRKRPRHQTGPPSSVEGAAKTRACRARAPAPNRPSPPSAGTHAGRGVRQRRVTPSPVGGRKSDASVHAALREPGALEPSKLAANARLLIGGGGVPRPTSSG